MTVIYCGSIFVYMCRVYIFLKRLDWTLFCSHYVLSFTESVLVFVVIFVMFCSLFYNLLL